MTHRWLRVALGVCYVAAVWWVVTPGRPPLSAAAWRSAAVAFATTARVFGTAGLVCEARYWQAVS